MEQGAQPDKNGFYFVSRSKIAEYIGYDINTAELKLEIEALRKEPIIINYLEKDGKPAIHGMGFISEYKITSNNIGYRLPSFIENVVRGDDESKKMFLLLNWDIFNSFTGKYEAIIYKLCKDYIGIGRTPYFTIEEYREYIGLKKSEYVAVDNLTRRCIKNPITNINSNKNCDISVQVDFKKQGRKIEGFYFTVEYKKQPKLPFEEFKPCSAFAFAKISISHEKQVHYLELYSEENIAATIERANEYIDQLNADGKPVNMGAIYNKAFSSNWGEQRLEENRLKQEEEDKKQNLSKWKKKQDELQKIEEAEKLDQKKQAEIDLINYYETLPNNEKTAIIETMLEKFKSNAAIFDMLNKPYLEHGVNAYQHSAPIRSILIAELKEQK